MDKDSIIFLIDCNPEMFRTIDEEQHFFNAVRCCIAAYSDKIISSASDLLGVCLYGTREKKNPMDFNNIYVFQDLDVPDAQRILDLESILSCNVDKKFGILDHEIPLNEALWICSTMFSNCSKKVGHRRIFLFTNEDNPNADNPDITRVNHQRAKDLSDIGIEIELFAMNKRGKKFDPTKFYSDIIHIDDEDDIGAYDASSKFDELNEKVRRKEFKKRTLSKCNIKLGDTEFSVKRYNLLSAATFNKYVWLDSLTDKPIKTITKKVCEDTGSILRPHQTTYQYNFGGSKISISPNQLKQLKALYSPEIRIVGFKPLQSLKNHHNMKNPSFLYPDNFSIKGSATIFYSLLRKMAELGKMAIGRMTAKRNDSPTFVALLPQVEKVENGFQIEPPGFHVIYLPYSEDFRDLKFEPQKRATEEQIDDMKKLVKSLRVNFNSRNFPNPALQKHFSNLKSLALDRETEEDVEDMLKPDVDGMMKFENMINEVKSSFFPENYVPQPTPTKKKPQGKKRKRDEAITKKGKPPAKKAKIVPEDIDWGEHIKNGTLAKLTIPVLKSYFRMNKIKGYSSWKKAKLIDEIIDHEND
eukprot:TRINITY_DN1757_c0_g1_i2.p1 TRINITY_DN1757_c0_g1~~TRINITY_DN1757_c0_g1_i2.p1  ORF type:complete len:584 (+),score=125.86 TRINITY_DN1757_c0_g1_i2:348-2099(+)